MKVFRFGFIFFFLHLSFFLKAAAMVAPQLSFEFEGRVLDCPLPERGERFNEAYLREQMGAVLALHPTLLVLYHGNDEVSDRAVFEQEEALALPVAAPLVGDPEGEAVQGEVAVAHSLWRLERSWDLGRTVEAVSQSLAESVTAETTMEQLFRLYGPLLTLFDRMEWGERGPRESLLRIMLLLKHLEHSRYLATHQIWVRVWNENKGALMDSWKGAWEAKNFKGTFLKSSYKGLQAWDLGVEPTIRKIRMQTQVYALRDYLDFYYFSNLVFPILNGSLPQRTKTWKSQLNELVFKGRGDLEDEVTFHSSNMFPKFIRGILKRRSSFASQGITVGQRARQILDLVDVKAAYEEKRLEEALKVPAQAILMLYQLQDFLLYFSPQEKARVKSLLKGLLHIVPLQRGRSVLSDFSIKPAWEENPSSAMAAHLIRHLAQAGGRRVQGG